ncbi:unnamed protein product [Rotaria socialis]
MSETAAIELLKRAVQLDNEGTYQDALSCYSEGIRMLLSAVKDIPSSEERKRAAYRQKITECIDRAEKLKDLIQQEKVIYFLAYILQYIVFNHAQNAQFMVPQDFCVPLTVTLRCASNYIVIVRSAFHGVSQTAGSCSYTPGDCIVDAMNSLACLSDSTGCTIHATKQKLPQCNDQFNSYFHIDYNCIPISMNDTSKEYDICRNSSDITTDNGIIKSPTYPSPFQPTTSECSRVINVPNNKIIRLWLSDLFIGSIGTNCVNDYVYVVDNTQTYQNCGQKKMGYPYLCSSKIIIQYLAKSNFLAYRGMRMYFEVVDRPLNDNCPQITVTPVPSITTLTTIGPHLSTAEPIYVTLGIASPTRSFQICTDESYTIECPNDYVVAIKTNIYGVTTSGQCEPHDAAKHCVVTTDPPFLCRQRCVYMYTGNEIVPLCNNTIASYHYVEYQCIPTKTSTVATNSPCPNDGSKTIIQINRNGRFQSYNYPNLIQMNCIYRLRTNPGYIMNIYALDISLNSYIPECKSNKITFIEDNETEGLDFCEQRTSSLVYSSCTNELDLRYQIDDPSQNLSYGVELYIENQVHPFDRSCGEVLSTLTNPTSIRTTPTMPIQVTLPANTSFTGAFAEVQYSICYGATLIHSCPSGYTFMILDAYYGVKSLASNQCEYVQGDCVQEAMSTITQCQNDLPSCYLPYSTKRRLARCSDRYADYLHISYQCVPSYPVGTTSALKVFDICDTNDPIEAFSGVITSPNYPNYKQTNKECQRPIIGSREAILQIWINEMAIASNGVRSLNDKFDKPNFIIYKNNHVNNADDIEQLYPSIRDTCVTDYLIIDTVHSSYIYCGKRKLTLGPICSSNIRIQYKTISTSNLFYKGFKLYFETVQNTATINCGGNPSTLNPLESTTTANEPLPDWAQRLDISPIFGKHLCIGTVEYLRCPRSNDYVISIVDSYYGSTGVGSCEIPTFSHCRQETTISVTCTHSCLLEYVIPRPLSQCSNQTADYLNIDYQCIPTRLPNNENPIDICASATTDTIAVDKSMLISPQYPSLNSARSCSRTIETLPSKLWMVYIVDLFLEGEDEFGTCNDASLTIYDGNDKLILCGSQQAELILFSCSNLVQFKFISSHQALGYRGFKVLFKTIDVPVGWSCTPSGFTTTRQTTMQTSSLTTLLPPSLQIPTYGGTTTNDIRQYCQFPFTYGGTQYTNCISGQPPNSGTLPNPSDPWCSLTSNFEAGRQWGFCDTGVTDSTFYDICRSQSKTLRCSPGYVIDIITADYAAKPDGSTDASSCIYNQNDCFQSDSSTIQNVCAGKTSCVAFHFSKSLALCQNRPSAYLHIDYVCVPNNIPNINTYDICNNNLKPQGDIRRGFINSPNFPNTQNNINCTYDLQILKPYQDIYLYIVDMDLNGPNVIGQSCTKDRLIVRADDAVTEWCGRSFTNILLKTCHKSVLLQLVRSSDARGRGVKFYFEFRERNPTEVCDEIVTPSTRPTLSPKPSVEPTTTTMSVIPSYYPDPSPRLFKTLCYPDLSALFGANNFQCPSNYIIVIHRAFYGYGNRCDYTINDCTSEADHVYRTCSGKRACSISFLNIVTLPECNKSVAKYLFVGYQCLPTLTIVQSTYDLCSSQTLNLFGSSGIIKSDSYPSYKPTQCNNVTIGLPDSSDRVIFMYLYDLDIGPADIETRECKNDYLFISYECNNQSYRDYLCGTRQTEVLFETCSSTDRIFVTSNLISQNAQSQRGFALFYHILPKSGIITLPPTRLPTTTTSSSSVGPGPVSTIVTQTIACVQQSIQLHCKVDYGLVLHKIDLAASKTGSCNYSPDDCFEERTYLHGTCGGKPSCYIFPPLISLPKCNNSKATYFYAEYQCIPNRPKLNVNICSSSSPLERVDGGAIISSFGYESQSKQCQINLQSVKSLGNPAHKAFSIFVIMLNLPIQSFREQGVQCNNNQPYIEIEDSQIGIRRLCGNVHTRKLFETCSNTIQIRYKNFDLPTNNIQYKGFQLYVESIEKPECSDVVTIIPPTPNAAFVIKNEILCALSVDRERISFSCAENHGLVFLQSYEFVTNDPQSCDISQSSCHFLSEQPQALCSGQQSCTYIHSIPIGPQLNMCNGYKADSIQFFYQCIPMKPTGIYPKATFCSDTYIDFDKGYIETPHYPNSYQYGQQQCSLRILLPNTPEGKQLSIYLYIIDLSIRDTSTTIDPTSTVSCYDSISYRDSKITRTLCGNIDQPVLEYQTDRDELELVLNITESLFSNVSSNWRGARLFFLIGNQSIPTPPTTSTTVTTQQTTKKTLETNTKKGRKHGPTIAGVTVGVIAFLLCIIGFIVYRRRLHSKSNEEASKIKYIRDTDTISGDTSNRSNNTRSSIPVGALKGTASSTFTTKTYHEQIQIKDGSLGNSYEKIFNRFLDESVTQVTVQDPYIRAFHQICNFLRFCEVVIKSAAKIKRIDLITSFETNEQAKQTQTEQLNQFKEHLANKHSIELKINYLTGLHDREIKLNNGWIVKIGRGLDFYKPPESKLSIGYYDLDLRPCHQTTIDIFHSERVHPST